MKELKLEEFIYQVKSELLEMQSKHEGEHAFFHLDEVELEVNVAVKMTGEGSISLYVVKAGSNVSSEGTHRVKMKFSVVENPDTDVTRGKGFR